MRLRITLPAILLWLFTVSHLAAGRSPDPTRARLVVVARLATFTERDFNALSSKADSGDREAQFWLGSIYEQGKLVPKDREMAESWFLQSAHKGYAPAERALGVLYSYDPAK
jgi:hypothetical protein